MDAVGIFGRISKRCLCLVLVVVTGAGSAAAGGRQGRDWGAVVALESGTVVRIEQSTGAQVEGTFQSATDDSLRIQTESGTMDLRRAEIVRVSRRTTVSSGHRIWKGFLVGAIGGLIQGLVTVKGNRLPWFSFLIGTWGGIGALIGLFSHAEEERYVVVFTAR